MLKKNRSTYILQELAHHLPYSIFGVSVGIVFMGILTFFATLMQAEHLLPKASAELFHVFHPSHILVSTVATTAMFVKHDRNIIKTIIVGSVGSIGICGMSDILFPLLGGWLLGADMRVHICILEEPGLVLPFAAVGLIAGFLIAKSIERSTEYSHSIHVFLSSVASILYLLGYGLTDWIHLLGGVFVVTIVAVMLPCCLSDIAFPLACVHKGCEHD